MNAPIKPVNFVELTLGEHISGEFVQIYAAVTNEDRTEGKGKQVDHSYYLTNHDALVASSGIGAMGNDGGVRSLLALRLADGRYFLLPEQITITENAEAAARVRAQARAKLTPAEFAALLGERK